MKKTILTVAIALGAFSAFSQTLPKPSPSGTSTYVVGATEISLDYSRPGVKDRTIFGDLLPYGELWRFGANASTKFTTTDALMFGDKTLNAGTYALFCIPKEDGNWEVIFNTDTKQSGTDDYSQEKDALRVTAKAEKHSPTETMTLIIDEVKDDAGSFVLLWENVRLAVPFTVDTKAAAKKNIEEAIKKGENLDQVYSNAAYYYYSALEDYDQAMGYIEKSLGVKETYRALFTKARILEKKGDKAAAIPLAEKAVTMAKADGSTGFANFVQSTIDKWKK